MFSRVNPYFSPSTALTYGTVSLKFARHAQHFSVKTKLIGGLFFGIWLSEELPSVETLTPALNQSVFLHRNFPAKTVFSLIKI